MKQEAQVNLSLVGQGEWTLDETLTGFAIQIFSDESTTKKEIY